MIASDAMIAESAQFLGEPTVVGGHHSAFRGSDVFDGMKAEGGQGAEAAQRPSSGRGTKRVTGILDDGQQS